jgi:hypothetical protein
LKKAGGECGGGRRCLGIGMGRVDREWEWDTEIGVKVGGIGRKKRL